MAEMFDFGQGPVPAHRHPNGGGWVADTAFVTETAHVGPDARVYGNAQVHGKARVYDKARVYGYACVSDTARVFDYAHVYGDANVFGNARVYECAGVHDSARVYGYSEVYDYARVSGYARVSRTPKVLTGFPYPVTITDHHVAAGCQIHPPSVWAERGAAIIRADGHLRDEARSWAAIINAIAEAHGCVDCEELEDAA